MVKVSDWTVSPSLQHYSSIESANL
ncbi:hypothetical protein BVI434_1000005 [Burkholderia vietnamiensis]|nr:hypothetical protein BVI1335_1020005 [Burkholderia vietnamiensis]CAG9190287.1 hypothetical protein BVI434_1000005 [Burkholderia vietnamiensis]